MNNFQSDLDYSHEQQTDDVWERLYKEAFPTMKGMHSHLKDGDPQRVGIDRTIILESGATISIDEKVRRSSWDDILLEYISNDKHQTPGWVEKQLICDYIAYLMEGTETLYILPVIQLQAAWTKNKTDWIAQFKRVEAKNPGYKTISCAVPINILFGAIGNMHRHSTNISN